MTEIGLELGGQALALLGALGGPDRGNMPPMTVRSVARQQATQCVTLRLSLRHCLFCQTHDFWPFCYPSALPVAQAAP
jgi:hypothetical protein